MIDQSHTQNPPAELMEKKKMGVFESILHRRFNRIEKGQLKIYSSAGLTTYGDCSAGEPEACIEVRNQDFFRKACLGGNLGVADSHADGDWDSPDLVALFTLLLRNMRVLDSMERGITSILGRIALWTYQLTMRNTPDGSRRNISLHYDLGNEFFQLMLDSTMTYSCGIFESENTTLEEASLAKYDRILDQLEVTAGTHILEIGCGWGGFAIRAAEKYGCKVTALTISQRQFEFAQKRVREAGLSDRVEIVLKDYRHIQGEYDRVVSIEMVEAVGHNYLPVYFSRISELLRDDGAAMIQAITMPDYRYEGYLKRVDYIRSRVFPGSCVPSVSALVEAAVEDSDLRPARLEDFGYQYKRTLQEWRNRFIQNKDAVQSLGHTDRFIRDWEYYLCYCEAGFSEGYTSDVHLLLTKPACRIARGFTTPNNAQ